MKTTKWKLSLTASALAVASMAACGSDEGDTDAMGGAGGSGGQEADGGSGSGGESASGGTESGGASAGGSSGSGGTAEETGGGSGVGGGSGGAPAAGGAQQEGGAAGASQGVDSGLPGDKTGDELSSREIQEVCEAVNTYAEETYDLDEAICRAASATVAARVYEQISQEARVAAAVAICTQNMDTCLDDPDAYLSALGISLGGGLLNCENAPESLEDCPATVDDYETCSTARVDGVAELSQDVPTCAELDADNLSAGAESGFVDLEAIADAGSAECEPLTASSACGGLGF